MLFQTCNIDLSNRDLIGKKWKMKVYVIYVDLSVLRLNQMGICALIPLPNLLWSKIVKSLQINILLLKTKDTKDYNYSMICQGYGLLGLYDCLRWAKEMFIFTTILCTTCLEPDISLCQNIFRCLSWALSISKAKVSRIICDR